MNIIELLLFAVSAVLVLVAMSIGWSKGHKAGYKDGTAASRKKLKHLIDKDGRGRIMDDGDRMKLRRAMSVDPCLTEYMERK